MRGGFPWLVLISADLARESWEKKKVVHCKGAEEDSQVHGAEDGNEIIFCQKPPSWPPALRKPGWGMPPLAIKFAEMHFLSTFKSAVLDGMPRCVYLTGFL